MSKKLSNVNILGKNRLQNKYEVTPLLEDDNYLDEYFRSVLKDNTPVKSSREDEMRRINTEANGVIDRRYGRESRISGMYKPDLFLGDMTKDPRSLSDSVNLDGFRKFMEHRSDALKSTLLNDNDLSISSKTMTWKEDKQNKDKVFKRVKDRYTNFEDGMVNLRSGKNLTKEELTRNKKSMATMVRHDERKVDNDRYVDSVHGNSKSKEFNNVSNEMKTLSDYSIGEKSYNKSKENKAKKQQGESSKTISSVKNMSSMSNKLLGKTETENDSQMLKKNKALTVMNLIDKKSESLDSYKLDGKKVRESIKVTSDVMRNKKNQKENMQNAFSKDDNFTSELKSHKENTSYISKLVSNRINRNHTMIDVSKLREDTIQHSKSHKERNGDYSKESNVKKVDGKGWKRKAIDISDSMRMSLMTGARINGERELVDGANGKTKSKPIHSKLMSRFHTSNAEALGAKKEREELTAVSNNIQIYSYRQKKPIPISSIDNVETERGRVGNTDKSLEEAKSGMRHRVTEYKPANVDTVSKELKETMDNNRYQIQTFKLTGTVGNMGSKYMTDKIEREEAEEDGMREITVSGRRY